MSGTDGGVVERDAVGEAAQVEINVVAGRVRSVVTAYDGTTRTAGQGL